MSGKSRLTPLQVERMAEMHAKGYSYRMIGERYGVSERHAARMVRALERTRKEGGNDAPMPV